MTEPKRKGRPARSADGPANRTITMRVNERLYEEISTEAEAHGRSLTAQAERRLLYREDHLTRIVGALVDDVEKRMRARGEDEAEIRAECRRVAHLGVEIVYNGIEGPTDDEITKLGQIRMSQSEFDRRMDDANAPYDLAKFKKGTAIPD